MKIWAPFWKVLKLTSFQNWHNLISSFMTRVILCLIFCARAWPRMVPILLGNPVHAVEIRMRRQSSSKRDRAIPGLNGARIHIKARLLSRSPGVVKLINYAPLLLCQEINGPILWPPPMQSRALKECAPPLAIIATTVPGYFTSMRGELVAHGLVVWAFM